jgi:hypothetical protein
MGRGGGRGGAKHSKNSCAGTIFTNHERTKVSLIVNPEINSYARAAFAMCDVIFLFVGCLVDLLIRCCLCQDKTSQMYGTVRQRLGGDAIKDFDCCSLTLQPCVDPVVTPREYVCETLRHAQVNFA